MPRGTRLCQALREEARARDGTAVVTLLGIAPLTAAERMQTDPHHFCLLDLRRAPPPALRTCFTSQKQALLKVSFLAAQSLQRGGLKEGFVMNLHLTVDSGTSIGCLL